VSNRRKPNLGNRYRVGYLASTAWFTRRNEWFREETTRHGVVRCAVCLGAGTTRTLELHHLDYTGVVETAARWIAGEAHEDLIAAHPEHHRLIHQLMDSDRVLSRMRSRQDATLQAISKLRQKIAHVLLAA
jgi:5-methylcytosine-specific restriction protein A